MKKICCIIIVTCLWGCGQSARNNAGHMTGASNTAVATATGLLEEEADADVQVVFSQPDAERILGEAAHLQDSATRTVADTTIFQSTYTANAADKKSGKTGNVYFMYEQYNDASTAHSLLVYYKTANEQNGAETISGLGDEAWFHTDDGQNFYFIMARKGNKMIRMKVNKVTANTSLDAFKAVAKDVVERI